MRNGGAKGSWRVKKSVLLLMSSCAFRARGARRRPFSICGLALVLILVSCYASEVNAKGTSLFSHRRSAEDDAQMRFNSIGNGYKRNTPVTEEFLNCTKITEGKEVKVVCGNETFYEEEAKDKPGSAAFFRDLFLCIFLVLTAGTKHLFAFQTLFKYPLSSLLHPLFREDFYLLPNTASYSP